DLARTTTGGRDDGAAQRQGLHDDQAKRLGNARCMADDVAGSHEAGDVLPKSGEGQSTRQLERRNIALEGFEVVGLQPEHRPSHDDEADVGTRARGLRGGADEYVLSLPALDSPETTEEDLAVTDAELPPGLQRLALRNGVQRRPPVEQPRLHPGTNEAQGRLGRL